MATAPTGSIDSWVEDEINAYFSTPTIAQTDRYRAYCQIKVNGLDVTNRLDPYLISVVVHDGTPWTGKIELDDRNGNLPIPPMLSSVEIHLGWTAEILYRVFTGFVLDVEHGFGRRLGGRRMTIIVQSADLTSDIKTPFQDHIGDGAPPGSLQGEPVPFLSAFQQFAGNAGLSVDVGPSFAGTVRDYWSMNNESIMQFASRHGDELGAFSRIEGKIFKFYALNDFNSPELTAQWGNNLISWRIHPVVARSLWGGAVQQYFDHVQGLWGNLEQQFNLPQPWGMGSATFKQPMPAQDSGVAGQANDGALKYASAKSGFGRLIMNGEPQAQWGSTVNVIGARPGVDGLYFVNEATHTWSRQGYVTTLDLFPNVLTQSNNIGALGYAQQNAVAAVLQKEAKITGQPQTSNSADGSTTTYYPDGTIVITNAVGQTTIAPDGKQTFQPTS